MSTPRGEGPLTTDDGWWQKADGSWNPPATHPLRDVPGFLEDLPEPPSVAAIAEQAAGSSESITDLRDLPEAEEPADLEEPVQPGLSMSPRAARIAQLATVEAQERAVSVAEAPTQPEIDRGPTPAERLSNAVERDEEVILLPKVVPPEPVAPSNGLSFKSEVVDAQPKRRRRRRQAGVEGVAMPATSDDDTVSFGSEVAEAAPVGRRNRRRNS